VEFLGLSSPEWQEVGLSVAIVVGAAILGRLVLWIFDQSLMRLRKHTRTGLDDAILDAIRFPLVGLIVILALQRALERLSFLPDSWEKSRGSLLFVLYLVVGYVFVHRLVNKVMQWYAHEVARKTESRVDDQVLPFARRMVLMALGLIAFIVLLSQFEVDVSAFVTTLGIGSLAVALAAQATLADSISGFVIMVDHPFRIGDRIEILELDTWGDVLDIGLRSTRIRTRDNRMVVVPNSVIGKNLIVNHSDPSTMYRVQTHVGVAYGTDVDCARQVLVDAVRRQEWVMKDRPIEALFIEWGDSAMVFRVRCWIEHYIETRRIIDKLNSCLYKALNEAAIESPFPTQTVYHRVDAADRGGLGAVLREAR
jgi:small-conductance mechanosensitive channel